MPAIRDARVAGACPSLAAPFDAADGLLVRLRLPAGTVSGAQALALAAAAEHGNGVIEITSRANLQLRGFTAAGLDSAAAVLVAAGLGGDGVDVVVSPLAGLDPTELVDARPVAAAIAAAVTGDVAPKFGVVVDAGGAVDLRGRAADVALGALRRPDGAVGFEVRIGAALPTVVARGESLTVVAVADVAAVVAAVAARGGRGADVADPDALVARATDGRAERRPASPRHRAPARPPVGRLPGAVGVAPLLGRLDPDTLRAVVAVAGDEIRFTPWRGIVLPGVAPMALDLLAAHGLVTRPDDAALRVVACAGRTGCASGLADAQADGRRLIAALRRAPASTATVHVSGCPKRCATRDLCTVNLIAGPDPDGYEVVTAAGVTVGRVENGAVEDVLAARP